MAETIGKVDRAAICLAEWVERGRGYHNSDVWQQWKLDTAAALAAHQFARGEMARLVKEAKLALLDHQIEIVAVRLGELEGLLQ